MIAAPRLRIWLRCRAAAAVPLLAAYVAEGGMAAVIRQLTTASGERIR
ncbi:MAG: hypothetical protein ACE5GB_15490 [Acidimicrobiales bacterium]